VNGVIVLSPIEPDEIEKILDEHEGKLEKIDGEIASLKTSCLITEKRLENIERSQTSIELGQIKNRELYLGSLNNVNQIMNKNTDALLDVNGKFLNYLTERDKGDNKTEVALNKGWNKREIILASITGFLTLMGIICGVYKLVA
jgi:hypothetical protein